MYFNRNCNRNYQCRNNRPSASQSADVMKSPVPAAYFNTVSAGGITLSGLAGAEKEYDLLYLDTTLSPNKDARLKLDFACNLLVIHSKVDIHLQIMKSGVRPPVPVASPVVYRRTLEFAGSDAISFTICDTNPVQTGFCGYLVKMYVVGEVPIDSMFAVTSPVLTVISF